MDWGPRGPHLGAVRIEGGPKYEAVWYKEISSQQELIASRVSQIMINSGNSGLRKEGVGEWGKELTLGRGS